MFETITKYTQHYVRLSNGCNVAYIDEGKGDKTLLFVHGLATYAQTWAFNIEALKDRYRCIAIDLPGNGYSDGGDYPYGINFYSGCVYDFML
ncbi:MAG: alpha/beta fold hydrolase, partial [Chitinophagaceae bacterium]|nr:alpha/beta fold hydrolase [Chitinophagaceae bacterium]